VRLKNAVLYRGFCSHHILELQNGAIAQTNEEVSIEKVDRLGEGSLKVDELL